MTDVLEFVEDFLQHDYDPVKAREYYLRTRELKGRQKKAADAVVSKLAPVKALPSAKVRLNPLRRISASEQKLIRAKSLANKVKDPKAKAVLLKRLSDTEKKLKKAMGKYAPSVKKDSEAAIKRAVQRKVKTNVR